MRFNFQRWVEEVQAKPEQVRLRYVAGCVAFSMLLVVGVWALSVSEDFRAISLEAIDSAKEAEGLLPKASNFSLDALLSGEKSLEERKREVSGELFFQQQLEAREKPNFKEEGFLPNSGEDTANPTDPEYPR